MPRYYFDFLDQGGEVIDLEGLDLPDIGAARREALRALREFAAESIGTSLPRTVTITARDNEERKFNAVLSWSIDLVDAAVQDLVARKLAALRTRFGSSCQDLAIAARVGEESIELRCSFVLARDHIRRQQTLHVPLTKAMTEEERLIAVERKIEEFAHGVEQSVSWAYGVAPVPRSSTGS